MKTLSEIEPRKPISSLPAAISEPGSYYVTGNLTGTGGIAIFCDDVTLDLSGFTLKGTATSGSGIRIGTSSEPRKNVTIKNGKLTGWQFYGVDSTYGSAVVLENLSGNNNRSGGTGNGGGCAIGEESFVKSCAFAEGSNSGNGFDIMGDGNKLTDCHAASGWNGFYTQVGYNSMTGCTAQNCGAAGFSGWNRDVITKCEAINCNIGIEVSVRASVRECVITSNGGSGSGVVISGIGAVIEGNVINGHNIGIETLAGSTGCLIVKNTVSQSTVRNFEVVAGNKVGEIVSAPTTGAISGNTGGSGVGTSTNPWANISF
jgi:hypothetical protein